MNNKCLTSSEGDKLCKRVKLIRAIPGKVAQLDFQHKLYVLILCFKYI